MMAGLLLASLAGSGPPSVRTRLGVALGAVDAAGTVERFAGIPYALPPLGELRFARAVEATSSWAGGVLDTTWPGPPCLQSPAGDPRAGEDNTTAPPPSEDCLHLTLWRPAGTLLSAQLPVLVFVFGGGLCTGYANSPELNASSLVARENVASLRGLDAPVPIAFGASRAAPGLAVRCTHTHPP